MPSVTDLRLPLAAALVAAAVVIALPAFGDEGDDDAPPIPLEPVAPHPSLALEPLPGADQIDCARCHAEIVAEWATTQHAHAWIAPWFQDEIAKKRRPESCTGCHAPVGLLTVDPARFGRKPATRDDADEPLVHGITCRSCHEDADGAMHGPFGGDGDGGDAATSSVHASVRDERFIGAGSDALCVTCHATTVGPVIGIAKDHQLARLSERGLTCVGCHMRPVERRIASDPDAPDAYPVRKGRSHRLQTPRDPGFLAASFELTAHGDEAGSALRIKNLAGHRVPGLEGRRIEFFVEALDASGEVVAEAAHALETTTYLPLEGAVDVRLASPAASLRVRGEHRAMGTDGGLVFLERTIPLP